jgi:hypothetical protein
MIQGNVENKINKIYLKKNNELILEIRRQILK